MSKTVACPAAVVTRESMAGFDQATSRTRSAISLFTLCTVPLPTPTIAATFRMPLPAFRCFLMASSTLGATLGPAKSATLLTIAL
jgi:hypothetical protein